MSQPQNQFLNSVKMHKLEFSILKISTLVKNVDSNLSEILAQLASVSHSYNEPSNLDLDVPDRIFNKLHELNNLSNLKECLK